jgi:hypothetical protein
MKHHSRGLGRAAGVALAAAIPISAMAIGAAQGAKTPAPSSIPPPRAQAQSARGPLRVHAENPRYFTDGTRAADGSLRAVYLTGAHTWNSLVDMGRSDPPEPFDFDRYLAFLERHHHNFIRLWAWDSTVWDTRANGRLGKPEFVHHALEAPGTGARVLYIQARK